MDAEEVGEGRGKEEENCKDRKEGGWENRRMQGSHPEDVLVSRQ